MNVLIIDDHPLYREGLKALLVGLDAQTLAVGVGRVSEAAPVVGERTWDLVLLDMNLPELGHLDALRAVKALFEDTPVVVVSAEEDPRLVRAVIDAGASGFIPKSTDPDLTIQALRVALAKGVYLPPLAIRQLTPPSGYGTPPNLSDKQTKVLQRLLQGKPNKAIASELGIAEGTVKAHLWAVYQALGVQTRSQAMCRALDLGLLG